MRRFFLLCVRSCLDIMPGVAVVEDEANTENSREAAMVSLISSNFPTLATKSSFRLGPEFFRQVFRPIFKIIKYYMFTKLLSIDIIYEMNKNIMKICIPNS